MSKIIVETDYVGDRFRCVPVLHYRVVWTDYGKPMSVEVAHKDATGAWSWNLAAGDLEPQDRERLLHHAVYSLMHLIKP